MAVSATGDGHLHLWNVISEAPEFRAPLMMSRVQTVEKALSTKMAYEQDVRSARRALEKGDSVTAARFVRKARFRKGYRRHPDALVLWERLYAMLPKKGFAGVEKKGIAAAFKAHKVDRCIVLVSSLAHHSLRKAGGVLGIGNENIIPVDVDNQNRINMESLTELVNRFLADRH